MALELLTDQGLERGDVKAALGQAGAQVCCECGVAGVVPVRAVLEATSLVAVIPVLRQAGRRRRIAYGLTGIKRDGRTAVVLEDFALVVTDNDQHVQLRSGNVGLDARHGLGCRLEVACDGLG